jgi:opacity protein-like surface antigen
VVTALLVVCAAGSAHAQSRFNFTGLLTGHVGVSATNDVSDRSLTPGVSMAVLDDNGVGVELDIAHAPDFDTARFTKSGITSAMLSVIAMRPYERVRPFGLVGAGVMRVTGTALDGLASVARTEVGWNAGGGTLFMVNDAFALQGDVRYMRLFSRHDDLPLEGNGVLDFWRTSIGVTFAWPIR